MPGYTLNGGKVAFNEIHGTDNLTIEQAYQLIANGNFYIPDQFKNLKLHAELEMNVFDGSGRAEIQYDTEPVLYVLTHGIKCLYEDYRKDLSDPFISETVFMNCIELVMSNKKLATAEFQHAYELAIIAYKDEWQRYAI